MASNDELQRVDATAAELQRWWQDAVIQRSSAIVRAERAEAELAALRVPCMWTLSKTKRKGVALLEPSCKRESYDQEFVTGMESATHFCPNCGHPVQVAE